MIQPNYKPKATQKLYAYFMGHIVIHGSHWQVGMFTWNNHIFLGEPGKGSILSANVESSVLRHDCVYGKAGSVYSLTDLIYKTSYVSV